MSDKEQEGQDEERPRERHEATAKIEQIAGGFPPNDPLTTVELGQEVRRVQIPEEVYLTFLARTIQGLTSNPMFFQSANQAAVAKAKTEAEENNKVLRLHNVTEPSTAIMDRMSIRANELLQLAIIGAAKGITAKAMQEVAGLFVKGEVASLSDGDKEEIKKGMEEEDGKDE